MSNCGDPHADGDCAEALERMFVFLDSELADADRDQIQRHLDACAPCLDEYALERLMKAVVARSCTERAPDELRQRVLLRIRQVQVRFTE